jgi:hypothetical protein
VVILAIGRQIEDFFRMKPVLDSAGKLQSDFLPISGDKSKSGFILRCAVFNSLFFDFFSFSILFFKSDDNLWLFWRNNDFTGSRKVYKYISPKLFIGGDLKE